MAKNYRVWLVGLLLTLTIPVKAEIVRDLYSASVPVPDQSAASLTSAAREALKEVLVKVTGTTAVLGSAAIAPALDEARAHVQQYAYSRAGPSGDELQARFKFDADWVNSRVIEAGIPLWTANRPSVLLWLVMEDARGRYFVNNDTAPGQAAQLVEAFNRRGVPVQLPLYDLSDTAAISPDEAWRLDGSVLRAASSRYGVQHIVSGRLAALASGQFVGDWSYLAANERVDRALTVPTFTDFVRAGVTLVADDMAGRYAVAAPEASGHGVMVRVSGVRAYADYAAIVGWLQSLEMVAAVTAERIAGEHLELRLQTGVSVVQLARLFELNQRLQPVAEANAGPALSYRWQS